MKEKIQKYQCKTCGEETEDKKTYLKGDCATCRLFKIKTKYMEQKLANVTKFSKHQEVKALLKKQKQFDTDESDYSDNISQDDNNDDSDYVPETPQISTGKSVLQKKTPSKKTPLKKTPSNVRPVPFPKPTSKVRPVLLPKSKSKLSPKKRNKKSEKHVELDPGNLETASRDTEESSSDDETTMKLKFTVKKDWQGTENYFPKNQESKNYVPAEFDDSEKELWHKLIEKRKREIEKELEKIFGNAKSAEKVLYSGRLRLKCPCPVENCEFRTVDMAKHLKYKHQWQDNVTKLQTNYFHAMFDSVTRMKTYDLHKSNICFKCYTFFDRIDNHLAHKHLQRETQEFKDLLATYYKQSKKVVTAEDTFSDQKIHNVQILYNKIEKFNNGEIEQESPEEEAPPNAATNEPEKRKPANKTTSKTSARNSLKSDKPGPSGYQKRQRGKYVGQKKGRQVTLLKNKIEITSKFRKEHKLYNKLEFRYYYDNTAKLLNDFKA